MQERETERNYKLSKMAETCMNKMLGNLLPLYTAEQCEARYSFFTETIFGIYFLHGETCKIDILLYEKNP